MELPVPELPRTQIIQRTRHRFGDIHGLVKKGWTISAIARRLNLDRKTVRRFRDTDLDELPASASDRRPGPGRRPRPTRHHLVDHAALRDPYQQPGQEAAGGPARLPGHHQSLRPRPRVRRSGPSPAWIPAAGRRSGSAKPNRTPRNRCGASRAPSARSSTPSHPAMRDCDSRSSYGTGPMANAAIRVSALNSSSGSEVPVTRTETSSPPTALARCTST